MRNFICSALIILSLLLAACAGPAPKATKTPRPSPAATAIASPTPSPATGGFAFGVEYMLPGGLAAAYAGLGAGWARSNTTTQFSWGTIEPRAPTADGSHVYDWGNADRIVAEWQSAGFRIQVYTNANNAWASSTRLHHIPDPQYMDDYEEFVFNLVERYDGDGDRDMPGLKAPILHYTVVEEWTAYFEGTADDYLKILAAAHRAIKRANSEALVGLVDFFLIDVFDGSPSPEEIERRAAKDNPLRHPMSEVRELLRHPDLFDVVEIHSLGDYTELYPTAEWLRAEMRNNGYEKPIWIGDALPVSSLLMARGAPALLPSARDEDFYTLAPIRPQDALRTLGWLDAIRDAASPKHDAAVRWWRALQAREVVKKTVVAIHAGYAGMNLAWLVERLNLGESVYAYRFAVRGRPVYVLWREAGRLYFPDEAEPAPVSVRVPLDAAQALVTHVITDIAQAEPKTERLAVQGDGLSLLLGSTPVFVEAEP